VYTYNVPDNQQPFEINQGILRTNSEWENQFFFFINEKLRLWSELWNNANL
jgi:hypothetical protein